MSKLHPVENMVVTMVKGILKRGETPPRRMTALLVMTIERLDGREDYTKPEETKDNRFKGS